MCLTEDALGIILIRNAHTLYRVILEQNETTDPEFTHKLNEQENFNSETILLKTEIEHSIRNARSRKTSIKIKIY